MNRSRSIPPFQPHQLVCLPYQEHYLYAEVVQMITERGLCWVRPLALLSRLENCDGQPVTLEVDSKAVGIQDLRAGPDLLCSSSLFRAALDTEIIPILTHLHALKAPELESSTDEEIAVAQRCLQSFLAQIWTAQPALFQTCSKD
jgi:hypothetical protein